MSTPAGELQVPAISELRHELRTPVNHILGYSEMLLEDYGSVEPTGTALGEIVTAVKDALAAINETLAPTRTEVTVAEMERLYQSLADPRERIRAAVRDLQSSPPPSADRTFTEDLEKILSAAARLGPAALQSDRRSPPPSPRQRTDPGSETTAPLPPRPPAPPGGGQILVVDDVAENREVLERRLAREGYGVVSAADGLQALDMIAATSVDLVLLDVLMPELDGYEVLSRLKDDAATRDIPVIMISALDDLPSIVRCIERGAEDYLPKPFDPVLLRARISACLEKKRLRDSEKEYLHRVNEVIAAATAVETGVYEAGALSDVARRDDALGRLARVFDGMAEQVRAREQRLLAQVRDLKEEIGAARESREHVAPAVEADLETGQRFADRFEILGTIGEGGMGKVYRARDTELGEDVAIKTLRPELLTDPTLIERFKSETRLARRITHQNVVRTHDFGEWAGVYYLTMEYVEGITVRELIDDRGRLGVQSTLAIARQLAESLAVAHDVGVIHRDIKPQNLLLDDEGILKVMDFGVARLSERGSGLTEAGLILGTPAYMPPEQMLAEAVDARCDLYAAGVVLYECLTGVLPFEAQSTVSLIAKVLNQDAPPPVTLNDEIPPALSALIVRLLAKKPDDRVQTATELAEQLGRLS